MLDSVAAKIRIIIDNRNVSKKNNVKVDFFILKSQDVKCRRYKDLGHSRKVSLMTKIGNGNGLLCRLHSKPHTVRSQKYIEMIVAFCDNLHYHLKAEFFFPIYSIAISR